jgi:DNA/RNA endonuclease YhcR with UshA esterase domain
MQSDSSRESVRSATGWPLSNECHTRERSVRLKGETGQVDVSVRRPRNESPETNCSCRCQANLVQPGKVTRVTGGVSIVIRSN